MAKKSDFYKEVDNICKKDKRYKADAYEFLMQALHQTQKKLNRQGHVNGKELLEGMREVIIDKYGPMAKTVLNHWGIKSTEDVGNIVFNMLSKRLLSKTERDNLDDFKNAYDFDEAFGNVLETLIK